MGLRVFRFPGSTTPTMVRRTGQNRPVLQKAHSTPFYIIVFDVASYMFLTSLSWASKAFENKACYRNLSFFCDEENERNNNICLQVLFPLLLVARFLVSFTPFPKLERVLPMGCFPCN